MRDVKGYIGDTRSAQGWRERITEPRPVPHSMEAEESVLGSILLDNDCLKLVRKIILPNSFYRDRHGWLFQAMLGIADRGCNGDPEVRTINQITVAYQLSLNGKLEACGGAAYLSWLIANTASPFLAADYARVVRDAAELRGQIGRAKKMEDDAYQGKSTKRQPPRRDKPGIGF